jgi:hypothetical protein
MAPPLCASLRSSAHIMTDIQFFREPKSLLRAKASFGKKAETRL